MPEKDVVVVADPKATQEKEPVKEETIEAALPDKKESKDAVPLPKYMEAKRQVKELEAELAQLKSKGSTTDEDLETVAKELGSDVDTIRKLDARYRAGKTVDPDLAAKLEALEKETRDSKLDKIFDGLWDKATVVDPDLMAVADKETLKKLALLPENQGMTLTQLAEKSYAKAVKGKPTIESSKPGARTNGNEDINFDKMNDDDWATVKNDPALKKKYDDHILGNLRF